MDTRLYKITATLLLAVSSVAAAADRWHRQEVGAILPPDQAFRLMPVEARGKTLRVEWEIAPGYYMYLNRLKFESTDPAAKLGTPKLPAGEKHVDPHFGEVVVQRAGRLVAELPVNGVPASLKLTYQGCAEAGVCLPPQTRQVAVVPVLGIGGQQPPADTPRPALRGEGRATGKASGGVREETTHVVSP